MRVVHVAADDGNGGASRGVQRLCAGQQAIGMDPIMFVHQKMSLASFVHAKPSGKIGRWGRMITRELDRIPRVFCKDQPNFDWMIGPLGIVPTRTVKQIKNLNPDIIHFHYIGGGLIHLGGVAAFDVPVVITCHDFWPVSALYHYEPLSDRHLATEYEDLKSRGWFEQRLARWQFKRKRKIWQRANVALVAPSQWMTEMAQTSTLGKDAKIATIPYGLDFERFQLVDRAACRKLLALPQDRKLLLYGAHNASRDPRKGYTQLCEAIRILQQRGEEFDLVVLGAKEPLPIDRVTCHLRTLVSDEVAMVAYYNACNATVMPSLQETFGQMGSESIACGTPAAAFKATGAADVIDEGVSGFYATPYEPESLSEAISRALALGDDEQYRQQVRDSITTRLDQQNIAHQHQEFYKSL